MITISRVYTFEAAHFLPLVPPGHKCKNMHGHSYQLTVEVAGAVGADGWIMDFSSVDTVVQPLVAQLDHRLLNDIVENPTSENLALWLSRKMLDLGLNLASLEVSETAKSHARWTPT